jgi:hypothetical protein
LARQPFFATQNRRRPGGSHGLLPMTMLQQLRAYYGASPPFQAVEKMKPTTSNDWK